MDPFSVSRKKNMSVKDSPMYPPVSDGPSRKKKLKKIDHQKYAKSEGVFCFQKKLLRLWMSRSHFFLKHFVRFKSRSLYFITNWEFFGRKSMRKFLQNFPAKFLLRWRPLKVPVCPNSADFFWEFPMLNSLIA